MLAQLRCGVLDTLQESKAYSVNPALAVSPKAMMQELVSALSTYIPHILAKTAINSSATPRVARIPSGMPHAPAATARTACQPGPAS